MIILIKLAVAARLPFVCPHYLDFESTSFNFESSCFDAC